MALTAAQRLALFQILEVPMFAKTHRIVVDGMIVETHDVTGSSRSAVTLIDDHVTTNIVGTDYETVLKGYLDDWINLDTDMSVVDQGSIGNVQGITDSIPAERDEIRRQVLPMVPFYRCHEALERSKGASAVVTVVR